MLFLVEPMESRSLLLAGLADLAPSNEATVPVPAGAEPAFPHIPTNEIPVCGYLTPNASFVTCSLEGTYH